ncbi:MAG: PcfJ domain-containing protein [Lysinibacillus sp.]
MNVTEMNTHFSEPSADVFNFVNNEALIYSRYLFIETEGKNRNAHCTHCEAIYPIQSLKHNSITKCQGCNSKVQVKHAGRGRGRLIDTSYIEYCEKSAIDKKIVTISGYLVSRDYRGDYKNVKTTITRMAMYVFKEGSAYMASRTKWHPSFEMNSSVFSLQATTAFFNFPYSISIVSFKKAVKRTAFQYNQLHMHHPSWLVDYMALFAKYPYIEVLSKIGLKQIVQDRLERKPTNNAINWRGKSLDRILRLQKRDWKCIKNFPQPMNTQRLQLYQMLRKLNENISPYDLDQIVSAIGDSNEGKEFMFIVNVAGPQSMLKAFTYIKKQCKESVSSIRYTIVTWYDYLKECQNMNLDITDPVNLYPRDLHAAHQRQIERNKVIADAKLNVKFKKRARDLQKMSFRFNGLHIRPVSSTFELTREGDVLKHCVAGYAKRHAEGTTCIFVIREDTSPDKPFYTLELSTDKQIRQCRGISNCDPTVEVGEFVDTFAATVLSGTPKVVRATG